MKRSDTTNAFRLSQIMRSKRKTAKRKGNLLNRKSPSFTSILKSIALVKTVKQLDKVQELVICYAGAPYKVTKLYDAYNAKNRRVRNINRLK